MIHYHGTPITPLAVLDTLAGRCFCTSYARPEQARYVHRIGQANMLDNGAFSVWRQGREIDWRGWAGWVEPWLDYRTTWAVLPDAIDAGPDENDWLLREWSGVCGEQGAPVWHLDEPIGRLLDLAGQYERVCFGSSGMYATLATPAWHRRVSEAFDALADQDGRVRVWVHMLRGMAQAGGRYPFASVDSTDIARNHNRPQNTAAAMAERWDAMQQPARWERVDQLALEEAS